MFQGKKKQNVNIADILLWSGQGESNSSPMLGRHLHYHYAMAAYLNLSQLEG